MDRSNFWNAEKLEALGYMNEVRAAICNEIAIQEFHKGFAAAVEANADNKERLISEVRKPLVEALQSAREIIYSTRAASSRYHLVPGNVAWEIHKKYSREIKVIDALLAQYK